MISSISRSADSPVPASSWRIWSTKPGERNCRAETLTLRYDRVAGGRPRPPGRVGQRPLQHPAADRHDEPALLGHLDEVARRDQAAGRVAPAHQGLEADGHAVGRGRRSAGTAARTRPRRRPGPARTAARAAPPRRCAARTGSGATGPCRPPWPRRGRGRPGGAARSPPAASTVVATPMLADVVTRLPSSANGSASALTIRSATCSTACGSVRVLDQHGELVAAEAGGGVAGAQRGGELRPTATSSWSPASWPSVSLTTLKSSRSTKSTRRRRRCARPGRRRAGPGRRTAPGWPGR